jgi:hypothetical protein
MAEWQLEADDLYAGAMTIDFVLASARIALSADFDSFAPVDDMKALREIPTLFG